MSWPFEPHIITRGFTYRDPIYEGGIHKAIDVVRDFDGLPGDPAKAVKSGTLYANPFLDYYGGWTCWIDTPDGERWGYYHFMQPTHIPDGTWVEAGTVVGYLGATGAAQGVHLHLFMWHRDKKDPTALRKGDWWAHNPELYIEEETFMALTGPEQKELLENSRKLSWLTDKVPWPNLDSPPEQWIPRAQLLVALWYGLFGDTDPNSPGVQSRAGAIDAIKKIVVP